MTNAIVAIKGVAPQLDPARRLLGLARLLYPAR